MSSEDDPGPVRAAEQRALLRIEHVSKTFGGTRALRDVSLELRDGEILALMGSNGSGKSTLIKTLAGYHHADPGASAWFDDEPFAIGAERHHRLRFVHQHLGLVLELGAMDNLALRDSFARKGFGRVDWRRQELITRELLQRFDLQIDMHAPLATVTPVERVIVAIVAAVQGWEGGKGLLVLDEPTAVLPPHEVAKLFEMIAEVRRAGASVLYVSHRLDEIFQIADRVAVLRGGELVAVEETGKLNRSTLASLMVGADVDADYRAEIPQVVDRRLVLEARDVHGRYLRGANLELFAGEIVGLAGLPGSGREELPYILAGAYGKAATGWLRFPGAEGWVDVAHAASTRIGFVPADRAREAVFAEFSVRENASLSVIGRLARRLRLSRRREAVLVHDWAERLQIKTEGIDALISSLSGGNQQKVVIARTLALEAPVLVLCEPTAGVDIATRIAIYDLVAELARQGLAVIISSSDVGDLHAMCTRVLVFSDGVPVREIPGTQLSEEVLLHAMEGAEEE